MSTPWTRFRNLCAYYVDCVRYSEKRQEYLFTDQLNQTFLLPALGANWHLKESFDVPTTKAQRFARNVLLTAEESDDLFIGYPLSSFISPSGTHCLCPVMMFPVHVTSPDIGLSSGLHVEVDRQGIDLNRDWVEFHVPRDRQAYFIRACERTDDAMGCMDVDAALQFISTHFRTETEPNALDYTLRHSDATRELLNTAVLFVGGKTKYTRNLISELNQARSEPDAVLDKTALAYVFRDPPLPVVSLADEAKRIPAVFTEGLLNARQRRAVEEALNAPVCKVTGPPGTGKSYMSVNLIANEVFNGGSVLFTSKNHKAIHAVFDMCRKVKTGDFDLVEFCTAPGTNVGAEWDKMQARLETVKDLATMHLRQRGGDDVPDEVRFAATAKVEEALDCFRDAEADLRRYDELRERVSRFERLLVQTDELLSRVPAASRNSDEFAALLRQCADALAREPRLSFGARIVNAALRALKLREPLPDVKAQLNALVPGIAPAVSRPSSVARSVRRLLKVLQFRKVVEGWRLGEYDAIRQEQSACNYEALQETLNEASQTIRMFVSEAFVDRLCRRVRDVEEKDLISRMKGSMDKAMLKPLPFLTAVGDGHKYDVPLRLFRDYQKILPAWAVTLLSLRKASPCLPGVFSLAVIDEASQCEIPPLIPALFRAQRVAVVGDPDQFPPVITMKKVRDDALRRKHEIVGVEMNKFSFCENNAFSVIPRTDAQTIRLTDHFRCADEIAAYFNEEFYRGGLCPCADALKGNGYQAYGLRPGMAWEDAPGGDDAEIRAAHAYLRRLRDVGFKGSVGVISPLRKLANGMKTFCFRHKADMPEGLTDERINTANGFQGGECDVILFLLGLNGDRRPGESWYVTADENKYIYNVSVSRAKVCFVAFGDRKRVLKTGLSRIMRLIPDERKPKSVKVGPGEIALEKALRKTGLSPVAQYPVCGRYLDLALVEEKVDVEVDGQAWHLDRNGCRKADDVHRDLLLAINGWKVVRLWHMDVMRDVDACVEKVKRALASAKPCKT